MRGKYILNGKEAVEALDLMAWAEWMEDADRHVAREERGAIVVSTFFLGLDHNYIEGQPPLLFETMIFGGDLDQDCERYSTWEEAEKGHAEMCERAFLPR